jgi:predicted DNA-binding protein (MmcQ/YjbR family)
MTLDQFLTYCAAKPGVEETFPFNETTLVMKVMGKMFALTGLDEAGLRINLKCDPDRSLELRATYAEVEPGYHMNKLHWNTIDCEGELPEALIRELIDHSYELVVSKLSRKDKEILAGLSAK